MLSAYRKAIRVEVVYNKPKVEETFVNDFVIEVSSALARIL